MKSCLRLLIFVTLVASAAAQVKGSLFPPGTFEAREDILESWYSAELTAMHEQSFSPFIKQPDIEQYRFLWLRTFHPPICITISKSGDSWAIRYKQGDGQGGYPHTTKHLVVDGSRQLTAVEASRFQDELTSAKLWAMPTIRNNDQSGTDGSEWVIEMVKDGKYHAVSRWSPEETAKGDRLAMRKLGLVMAIELGGLNVPRKDIY